MERGYIHLYTGEGKGKTTASVGLALRALHAGMSVAFFQFMKGVESGEISLLQEVGKGKFSSFHKWDKSFILTKPLPYQKEMAEELYKKLLALLTSGAWDVVVADEICPACAMGLLSEEQLLALCEAKPPHVELIFTGQGASDPLVEQADLVTHMTKVKHYYDAGVHARKGVEF